MRAAPRTLRVRRRLRMHGADALPARSPGRYPRCHWGALQLARRNAPALLEPRLHRRRSARGTLRHRLPLCRAPRESRDAMTTIVYIFGIAGVCAAIYFVFLIVRVCLAPELKEDMARLREHRRLRIASRR